MSDANLFSSNNVSISSNRASKRLVRNDLKQDYPVDKMSEQWRFDPPGVGVKSTQQLNVDWTNFASHTFFHSAEVKVNAAYQRLINHFPYDGDDVETRVFLDSLTGWENYVYQTLPKYLGYLNFESTNYITITDMEGYLFPTLAKSKSYDNIIGTGSIQSGYTIECFFRPPTKDGVTNGNQIIFQKLDTSGYNGITLAVSRSLSSADDVVIHSLITSGSASDFTSLHVSGSIPKGEFSHISTVYDKGKTDNLYFLVNGSVVDTSENKLEFNNLDFLTASIYVGTGSSHLDERSSCLTPSQLLTGSLDEFRFWVKAKTIPNISSSLNKSAKNKDNLGLYLKFNEPTGSYTNSSIVLDSSGKGLHGQITNYSAMHRRVENSLPVTYEDPNLNPVLFPDHPDLTAKNIILLGSASNYDANNPNYIINLVPKHYLEFDQIQPINPSILPEYTSSLNFPGSGEMPSNQIFAHFLFMWSAFFDDLKMHIDSFGNIYNLQYTDVNGIPIQAIQTVARQFGYELPNIFSDASPAQFHHGVDLTEDKHYSPVNLKQILFTLWRRFICEIPHIQREKGTISGIRMFLNSFGINANSNFRLREFGNSPNLIVENRRIEKRKPINVLEFSTSSMFLSSSNLLAYRWAPGYPNAGTGSIPKIEIRNNSFFAIETYPKQYPITSASWAIEGHYMLNERSKYITQSLVRLDASASSGNPYSLLNIMALSGSSYEKSDYSVRAVLASHDATASPIVDISLKDVNLFDGTKWYINVNNHYEPPLAKLELKVIRAVGENIYDYHVTSSYYNLTASHPLRDYVYTDVPGSAPITDKRSAPKPFMSIGSSSYSASYLQHPNNATNYGVTDIHGKVAGIRIWSKALSDIESKEHALNPNSIGADNSYVNSPFAHLSFDKLGMLGKSVFDSYQQKERLEITSGSWNRLRFQTDFINEITSSDSAGKLEISDLSQNGYNINVRGAPTSSAIIQESFENYSILDPNWDNPNITNKVRVRSYMNKDLAERNKTYHGRMTKLDPREISPDDKRFSLEASVVSALNEDIVNVLSDMLFMNDAVGAPENLFAVNYPDLDKIADKYFNRLTDKVVFKKYFEFFKWFDTNFGQMISELIPQNTEFLGVNFVIESHMLERHKLQYQQADVHIDLKDRLAARIEPILEGSIRKEII